MESREELVVPPDFDPGELSDMRVLYGRMTPSDHRWAGSILDRETNYPVHAGYAELARCHELDELPARRLREIQYQVATRGIGG